MADYVWIFLRFPASYPFLENSRRTNSLVINYSRHPKATTSQYLRYNRDVFFQRHRRVSPLILLYLINFNTVVKPCGKVFFFFLFRVSSPTPVQVSPCRGREITSVINSRLDKLSQCPWERRASFGLVRKFSIVFSSKHLPFLPFEWDAFPMPSLVLEFVAVKGFKRAILISAYVIRYIHISNEDKRKLVYVWTLPFARYYNIISFRVFRST